MLWYRYVEEVAVVGGEAVRQHRQVVSENGTSGYTWNVEVPRMQCSETKPSLAVVWRIQFSDTKPQNPQRIAANAL